MKGDVDYSIEWKSRKCNQWKICDGRKVCKTPGSRLTSSWNFNISNNSNNNPWRVLVMATVQRGVQAAFNNSAVWPITLPKRGYGCRLRIHCEDYNSGDLMGMARCNHNDIPYDIIIWGGANNSQATTDVIISKTFHELGHQSHYKKLGDNTFSGVAAFISESWARCLEWKITNDYYSSIGLGENLYNTYGNNGFANGFQTWTYSSYLHYTPVFIDMIDNYDCPGSNDNISGYTLQEINNQILPTAHNLTQLKSVLKTLGLHGTTAQQVDDLLYRYEQNGIY